MYYFITLLLIFCRSSGATTNTTSPTHSASLIRKLFDDFCRTHNKTYNSTELQHRLQVFKTNLGNIFHLKSREKSTAEYAVNKFADLTDHEFAQHFFGHRHETEEELQSAAPLETSDIKSVALPRGGIDWRNFGAVTPVKSQGHCGSCWAFATSANIESVWKIKKGGGSNQSFDLSPQHLVDCVDGNNGCHGGSVVRALDAVKKFGGLHRWSDYPYIAKKNNQCLSDSIGKIKTPTVYINGSVRLPADEDAIAQYVLQNGPVSVGVNAAPWRFYKSGILKLSADACDPDKDAINHAVLLVGFATENAQPYWIIKNSYGADWGEHGYIKLARGFNTCGIKHRVKAPIIH